MEIPQVLPRKTQSCRFVSFENNRRKVVPLQQKGAWSTRWQWPSLERGVSRLSSHYCDFHIDDDDDDGDDVEKASAVVLEEEEEEEKRGVQRDLQKQKNHKSSAETRLSIILLDQGLFTVYKRLLALCCTLNVIALVLAIVGRFPYARKNAAAFSMGNILVLTLCRSEAFLRVLFWLSVKLLGRDWVPLPLKTAATSFLQSLGGIHSGCGVSAIAWLVFALVRTIQNHRNTTTEIVAVASVILSLLCLSSLAAFPLIRHLHHNAFERTHRFAGWTALAFLWVFVTLTTGYDPATKSYSDLKGSKLAGKQEFWLTAAITLLTILPWVTVRKVPVSVTAPSGHASIIKFAGGIRAGILGRISRSPLSEWHAFGIISDGKDSHMMLAGAVGDFTKGLVSDPPRHLWVRGVRFAGLPYLVNMYSRVVLVATGSGICVFLSFLLQPCAADVCIVWVTKGVEQNFGREIKEMMSGHPKEKVIVHDTAVLGRPNVAEMAVAAARNWKAEAVVVTSNPEGSRDVVRACNAAGFAAFGPIWDS